MSSLQDIMNVDEDPKTNKRPNDPTTSTSSRRHPHRPTNKDNNYNNTSSPSTTATHHVRYSSVEGNQVTRSEDSQPKGRNSPPAQHNNSLPSLAGSAPDSAQATTSDQEHSTTSVDSMDPSYGHGHPGSSGHYGNTPMRPFVQPSHNDVPAPKLTPITGRVSRAKKGVPVHTCDQCRPPKIFTRAEHLRRHQLSHQTPKYVCTVPACDKAFHRKDLLDRHRQRHEIDGDKVASKPSSSYSGSRRTSTASAEGANRLGMASQGYVTPSSTPNMSMTPGMTTNSTFQSMGSPAMSQSMSPQMGGATDQYQPSSSGGQGYSGGYQLSNDASQSPFGIREPVSSGFETPPSLTAAAFSAPEYSQPRTTPGYSPLIVQTKGLPNLQTPALDMPPELSFQQDHWPSSATDSPYSTPSDRAVWSNSQRASSAEWQNTNLLSPYQNAPATMDSLPPNGPIYFPYTTSPPLGAVPVFAPSYEVLPGYSEDQTIIDLHHHHRFANTVRSTTPPTAPTLAQGSEILVSSSTALPSDRLMNSLACLGRQKEVAVGLLASPALVQSSLPSVPASVYRAIPDYLDVYWEKVQDRFPIIHRSTFEGAAEQLEALRFAMAAVATQHLSGREDRNRGNQLHEFAWQQATKCTHWDVPVMQAILLCELFARFRGRRAAIRPSNQFRNVYGRVLDANTLYDPIPMEGPNNVRWHKWLDQEARRRLLAGCFVLDVHASVYQEQHRVRNLGLAADDIPTVPLTSQSHGLWEAPSADSWAALAADASTSLPAFLSMVNMEALTKSSLETYAPFDKSIILAHEMAQLQSQKTPTQTLVDHEYEASAESIHRLSGLFPDCPVANTYLALHHTPLHDLLAVSGESWVFSHKLLHESTFAEQKKRLRQWSSSPKAAAAAVYACRALRSFTLHGNQMGDQAEMTDEEEDNTMDWEMRPKRMWRDDISDYWGMYVCALICWAFGHHAGGGVGVEAEGPFAQDVAGDAPALGWVHMMSTLGPEEAMARRSQGETVAVVGLARRWLGADGSADRNRLYTDAVRVLGKLEDGAGWTTLF